MSCYVYAVTRDGHPLDIDGEKGVGAPPEPVRVLRSAGLAAVVSDAPEGLRAKRRDLEAHQRVLDRLMGQGTALPMRFGTLADSEDAVLAELERSAQYYRGELDRLDGRVEVNVKAAHLEEAALREALLTDPELRAANEELRAAGGGTHDQRIAFGEQVADALERLRGRDADRVLEALRPHAERLALGPPVDGCLANVSLLVDRSRLREVDEAVQRLRAGTADLMEVRVSEPLPPYSFVAPRPRQEQ
ncbi:GvpL/GvpF family gas vesicle protein [Marinitenerispora sediminis]|uniref:Gas vesicle protein GvpFL n=1 Tax=Marinitenerispora sediminis TaxID=1931232 RepID=A0A368T2W1_9ACTN|nr:GvpL/GvpF family gas vesicle protein [Marinitenerispora sediminis]RCV47938.1 gas vesicle protein GvpFL [Marinitenerispora sediminis]RCV51896.1 gas vesicle protein GvpFL [Marinitenerispora sediminis]RCV55651.1 gas vesicle protein GvpFL [Marinitenerispora sediminis]